MADITDLDKAKLTWTWDVRTKGPVTHFRLKIGVASGVYDNPTTVDDVTLREYPMRGAGINAPGLYYYVYCGINAAGEGENSDEISFNVVMPPPKPSSGGGVRQDP